MCWFSHAKGSRLHEIGRISSLAHDIVVSIVRAAALKAQKKRIILTYKPLRQMPLVSILHLSRLFLILNFCLSYTILDERILELWILKVLPVGSFSDVLCCNNKTKWYYIILRSRCKGNTVWTTGY